MQNLTPAHRGTCQNKNAQELIQPAVLVLERLDEHRHARVGELIALHASLERVSILLFSKLSHKTYVPQKVQTTAGVQNGLDKERHACIGELVAIKTV
jgi:hypothetical protein